MAVETTPVRPRFIPSIRFLLALLVNFGFVIQYAQRTNMSIAIVCMVNKTGLNPQSESKINVIGNHSRTLQRTSFIFQERQFLWNEWDQQIVLGSYWGGYLLTLIPSGWLSITLGAKLLFTIAIFISSFASIALSSVYFFENISFVLVVSLRIIIGAAHGVIFPVTYTLWGQWAVPDERGTLSSIGFSGTNIGTAFILLIGGLLCRYVSAGWVHIFLLAGILGFLWLPFWIWLVADSPAEHRSISANERDYIQDIIGKHIQNKNHRPLSLISLPWKTIVRSKPVVGLFFTELCSLFGFFFMLRIIADRLVRRDLMTLTNVRKFFNSIALFGPGLCMITFCFCDENHKLLGIITVNLFLLTSGVAYGSGYIVNFSDIVPAYSGLMFGIATSVSSLNAVIGNIIAGVVIKQPTLHDWRKLFIAFFVVYLIGGLIFLLMGSAVPEKWATFRAQEQEQNGVHVEEETVPMQEQQPSDEIKATDDNQTKHVDA